MARFSRSTILAGTAIVVVLGMVLVCSVNRGPSQVDRIAHADPEIQAASKRAQGEIDIFLQEMRNPVEGDQFFVKGGFKTDAGMEYLWVKRVTFDKGSFTGILDQPPMAYREARRGDQVTVRQDNVYDWMIKNGSHMRGGYTEKVLNSR